MTYYAGIDVSLEYSSVCVVDGAGKIIREQRIASEPEALIAWFRGLGFGLERIGLEAGPMSQWLHAAMRAAGLAVELLETRHVRDAFKAMPVKSDRNDARGIAQLMRLGWFRPVHCKSMAAQEMRALLTARKLVQSKLLDVQMSLRGLLRGFGLKVGATTPSRFAGRIRDLVEGNATLEVIAAALLAVHETMRRELAGFEKRVRSIARSDGRVRLLMSTPGVGAIVALTYVAAIDDPARFKSSKGVGAHFGLTPKKYQSGETDINWTDQQDRRRGSANGALRGRPHHPDPAAEGLHSPQELGDAACQTRRHEEGKGGARPQARRDHASHAGRWNTVRFCRCGGLTGEFNGFRAAQGIGFPKRSPSPGRWIRSDRKLVSGKTTTRVNWSAYPQRTPSVAASRRPRTEASARRSDN